MAASDKNIVISPQRGSTTLSPTIAFTGDGNDPVTLYVPDGTVGSLSFEGSAGQLFSITNNLTSGSIFSVNDVSGIPSLDIDASGLVQIAPLGGEVALGQTTVTAGNVLDVKGNVRIDGDLSVTGTNLITNLNADLLDGQDGSYYLNTSTIFSGDVSGTYNAIIVANDSHTHDTRYYTETESDARFLGISAKAADSNLLDGIDSGSFLRSDAADTATGTITISGLGNSLIAQHDVTGGNWSGRIISKNATLDCAAFLASYNGFPGLYAHNNALNAWHDVFINSHGTGAGQASVYLGTSYINGNIAWHAGNDGSGSGLDADTLDGINSGSFLRSDAADVSTGNIAFNGTLATFNPPGGGTGTDTATDVALALGTGHRIAGWVDGYIRTLLEWNSSGDIEIGQGGTSLINGINLLPGSSGVAKVNGSTIWHAGNLSPLTTSTTFGGDVSGTYNAIVVANDSHSHAFNNLTGKTSGTGDYATTGDIVSGKGSGGVALTINDGKGNANVTFNHQNGVPEQNGNAARIEVNTDSTSGATMYFELKSGVTGGSSVDLNNGMTLTESSLTVSGDINSSSDVKLKTNIKTLTNSLDKVLQMRGVEFDRIDLNGRHQIGVIAQEVEEIVPELVSENNGIKSVSYGNITALLIEAIKEQQKQIEALCQEISDLRSGLK